MANIELDIPDTRVVVRQPSVIVDRSKLPIQSVAEFALTSSYATYAKTIDSFNIGVVGNLSASGAVTASELSAASLLLVSGSAGITGSLTVTDSITANTITATSFSGSFTGLITSASFAQVALAVLQDTFSGSFSGSYYGNGSALVFNTINTFTASNSTLIVGNAYNNYQYAQTTTFRNGNIVVSGSATISPDGLLILSPRSTPLTVFPGGLFYSSSGEFYVGM